VLTNTFQSMTGQIDQLIRENYQKELDVRASQLKALQAQINPHFLYNCLSLINSKALMNHQPEISKMALQLSTFYRTTLNKGKSTTLLQNEVKNVTSYVEIQQLLHDGCFDFTAQIDQPLPDVTVPNLLLQPLVENAIIHGILPEKERRGSLFLAIHTLGDRVQCTIMDNGVGIPPEKLSTLLTTDTGGYGLKNVHDRLVLTYGPEFGLTIRSIPGQSTIITFRLPGPTAAEQAASAAGKEST
jgi:two-component system sensor histidine kinase YesM